MLPSKVFELWARLFEAETKIWSKFNGRYRWVVEGEDGGVWLMDSSFRPRVTLDDGSTEVDLEVRMSSACFMQLIFANLNPQLAVIRKEIVLSGRTKHALRFNLLLEALLCLQIDASKNLELAQNV